MAVLVRDIALDSHIGALGPALYGVEHLGRAQSGDKETLPHLHYIKWEHPLRLFDITWIHQTIHRESQS